MTIFSNFINQDLTSDSKVKRLRCNRLRSSALARNKTHNSKKQKWTKKELKSL